MCYKVVNLCGLHFKCNYDIKTAYLAFNINNYIFFVCLRKCIHFAVPAIFFLNFNFNDIDISMDVTIHQYKDKQS